MTTRLKFLIAMLTGFALGVALCAAWFLALSPPVLAPRSVVAAPINLAGNDSVPKSESAATPWKSRDVKPENQPTGDKGEEIAQETEITQRRILAHRNHAARTRALHMSSWLGLDSRQSSSLEALLLEAGADGILEIPSALVPWVKSNLRPEQSEAYTRYQQSTQKDEAEASALKEVHELAQVVELSEEQRDAIFQNKFEFYQMWAGFDSLVFTGPIINHRADPVVITESRIEMPVFSTRRVSDGLLTEEQAHAFGEFKRKERELEELKAREQE